MLTLKRITKQFVGSSFPVEIETVDGPNCILKMRGSGNGPVSLVQEYVVNRLASRLGWPVPDVVPVAIPEGFPWNFGTDEFDDLLQRSFGVNLGIRFIAGLTPEPARNIKSLPEEFLARVAAIDAFFCNFDRTLRCANIERDAQGELWIIDHGSCQFTDLLRGPRAVTLAPNHFLKPEERELLKRPELRELANSALLEDIVHSIPGAWLNDLRVSPSALANALVQRAASVLHQP